MGVRGAFKFNNHWHIMLLINIICVVDFLIRKCFAASAYPVRTYDNALIAASYGESSEQESSSSSDDEVSIGKRKTVKHSGDSGGERRISEVVGLGQGYTVCRSVNVRWWD